MKQKLSDFDRERLDAAGIDSDDQEVLLAVIGAGNDARLVVSALRVLRPQATSAAIPVLKQAIRNKNLEVKHVALCLLSDIARENEAPLYVQLLDDFRFPARWAAMRAVSLYAGPEAVGSVAKKVIWIATQGAPEQYQADTRLVLGVRYLARYADVDPIAANAIQKVAECWDELLPPERQTLIESVPYFATYSP